MKISHFIVVSDWPQRIVVILQGFTKTSLFKNIFLVMDYFINTYLHFSLICETEQVCRSSLKDRPFV